MVNKWLCWSELLNCLTTKTRWILQPKTFKVYISSPQVGVVHPSNDEAHAGTRSGMVFYDTYDTMLAAGLNNSYCNKKLTPPYKMSFSYHATGEHDLPTSLQVRDPRVPHSLLFTCATNIFTACCFRDPCRCFISLKSNGSTKLMSYVPGTGTTLLCFCTPQVVAFYTTSCCGIRVMCR